jgi:SAM-dependent methyltransferase
VTANDVWSERAEAYRRSAAHASGPDLDLVAEWAAGFANALDVASGGGHTARRLREGGLTVTTLDPAPGMRADVLAPADHIPFADGSFDVVVSRIAPHHFPDVREALVEMARVSRALVLVVDNVNLGDDVEAAERLRDSTHVRCLTEVEWRRVFDDAGLDVDEVRLFDVDIDLADWLDRAGCTGSDADEVRALLGDRVSDGRLTLTRIAVKGRKRT